MDINMLVNQGGRERTASEFRTLFDQAGFELENIVATTSPLSIVIGKLSLRTLVEPRKEAPHRRRGDAPGNLRTIKFAGVVLSAFEHRLDRTVRTYLSFIGAPESDRLP